MKKTLGCIRKADTDFGLIDPGDRIAVGVSGGKDSLLLLHALSLYRKFTHKDFSLVAVTVDMGLEPFDLEGIRKLCGQLEIPYEIRKTDIGRIIFDYRKEKNPCSLCSKMRRAVLSNTCVELGCGKLALGHHREDVIDTLFMSLFQEQNGNYGHSSAGISSGKTCKAYGSYPVSSGCKVSVPCRRENSACGNGPAPPGTEKKDTGCAGKDSSRIAA